MEGASLSLLLHALHVSLLHDLLSGIAYWTTCSNILLDYPFLCVLLRKYQSVQIKRYTNYWLWVNSFPFLSTSINSWLCSWGLKHARRVHYEWEEIQGHTLKFHTCKTLSLAWWISFQMGLIKTQLSFENLRTPFSYFHLSCQRINT